MIRSSVVVKSSALAVAVAVHGALGWSFLARHSVDTEGQAGASEAALGGSFADLAAGVMTAEPVDVMTPVEAVPVPVTQPVQPSERALDSAQPVETLRVQPEAVAQRPLAEGAVRADRPTKTAQTVAAPQMPVAATAPAPSTPALEPVPKPPVLQRAITPTPKPVESTKEMTQPQQATALARSLRPPSRPRQVEVQARAKPVVKPQSAAKTPRGNSAQNARAGTATGQEQATAPRQATAAGRSSESGNAAASNYAGLVMKKIARVPKPRVGSRGAAIIQFSISGSGGLNGASVAQSSGSPSLDQAALRVIKRAAPFPPPPAGARRSFSIRIKGAG